MNPSSAALTDNTTRCFIIETWSSENRFLCALLIQAYELRITKPHCKLGAYRLDDLVSNPGRGKDFSFSHCVQTGSWAHKSSYLVGVHGSVLPEVKRTGREANHTPPLSADISNDWICTSTSPYVFMAWCWKSTRDLCFLTLL
jgi:hypothetical protein